MANAKSGQNLQNEATPLKIWQKNVMFELNLRTHIRKGEHGMEIIICDDNLSERSLMVDYILKWASEKHLEIQINTCKTGWNWPLPWKEGNGT